MAGLRIKKKYWMIYLSGKGKLVQEDIWEDPDYGWMTRWEKTWENWKLRWVLLPAEGRQEWDWISGEAQIKPGLCSHRFK